MALLIQLVKGVKYSEMYSLIILIGIGPLVLLDVSNFLISAETSLVVMGLNVKFPLISKFD
jgi:hypothetical protein